MLAYHYSRSDNHSKAYQYLRLSGERALRNYANWEAFRFYKEAIGHLTGCLTLKNTKERRLSASRYRFTNQIVVLPEGSSAFSRPGRDWPGNLQMSAA